MAQARNPCKVAARLRNRHGHRLRTMNKSDPTLRWRSTEVKPYRNSLLLDSARFTTLLKDYKQACGKTTALSERKLSTAYRLLSYMRTKTFPLSFQVHHDPEGRYTVSHADTTLQTLVKIFDAEDTAAYPCLKRDILLSLVDLEEAAKNYGCDGIKSQIATKARGLFGTLRLRPANSNRIGETTCSREISLIDEVYRTIKAPKSGLRTGLTRYVVDKAVDEYGVDDELARMVIEHDRQGVLGRMAAIQAMRERRGRGGGGGIVAWLKDIYVSRAGGW